MWMFRLVLLAAIVPACALAQQSTIPVVGCASDGQQGPRPGPANGSREFALPAAVADKLAYYQGPEGSGVLAPRGWHCLETVGSNGDNLIVAPTPLTFDDLILKHHGIAGAGIQLSMLSGSTSGRFEVARTVARVFPKHRDFVQKVVAENFEPASDFPYGAYPTDKLHYLSDHAVEYTTPGGAKGLGTASWLTRNATAIQGFAAFDPAGDNDLSQLAVRIPGTSSALVKAIVMQAEFDTATR